MKRHLLALVLLLAVSCVASIAWFAAPDASPALTLGDLVLSSDDAHDALESDGRDVRAIEISAVPLDPSTHAAGDTVDLGVTDADGALGDLEVLAVERGSDRPVVGARIRILASEWPADERGSWQPFEDDDLEAEAAAATVAFTDADGRAHLPRSVRAGKCCGRKGELFGFAWFEKGAGSAWHPLRIELAPERTFVIQVQDAASRAVAGVPVALRLPSWSARPIDVWTGTTSGKDGAAIVRHVDLLLARAGVEGRLVAHLAIPARASDLQEKTVDVRHASDRPVQLVLPPCGSIEVLLRDPSGASVRARGVTLCAVADLDERGEPSFDTPSFLPDRMEPGRAVFSFVGLDMELAVAGFDGSFRNASLRCAGPRWEGERTFVRLGFPEARPVLAARALLAGDVPLARRNLRVELSTSDGVERRDVRTDAGGRWHVDAPFHGHPCGAHVRLSHRADDGTVKSTEIDVVVPIGPGENDLGDVHLQVFERVPLGRVVDEHGRPIEGARIRVDLIDGSDEPHAWNEEPEHVDAWQLGGGVFELRGASEGQTVGLCAFRAGFVQRKAGVFALPSTGIVIELERACRIGGHVLLDDDVAPNDVLVTCRRRESGPFDLPIQNGATAIAADGSFELEGLVSGTVDLVFTGKNDPEPLRTIEEVALFPGLRATDARLETIDLRRH